MRKLKWTEPLIGIGLGLMDDDTHSSVERTRKRFQVDILTPMRRSGDRIRDKCILHDYRHCPTMGNLQASVPSLQHFH